MAFALRLLCCLSVGIMQPPLLLCAVATITLRNNKARMPKRLLQNIRTVIHNVADLNRSKQAWADITGFSIIDEGTLPESLCAAWNAPAAAGSPYVLFATGNKEPFHLRLVETGNTLPFGSPMHYGWMANELLAEDVDELTPRLHDSEFTVIGGPHDLFPRAKAPRAVQTTGPDGELVYFTRIIAGGTVNALKPAESYVDRSFNLIAAGPDIELMRQFYEDTLGQRMNAPIVFRIPYLAAACGVTPDTPFHIQVAKIGTRRSIIELDQLPGNASPRPQGDGELPPGIAMVGFNVSDLDALPVAPRAAPAAVDCAPYNGARVAVIEGPAGEWLELIEE